MTSQISIIFQHEQPRGIGDLTDEHDRNIACDHQFHMKYFYRQIGCQMLVMINHVIPRKPFLLFIMLLRDYVISIF